MTQTIASRTLEILLVEDNPGDVRLTREALRSTKIASHISVATDGVDAMAMLFREGKFADFARPDLILLDLNLPRKDGREVLVEIKRDANLRRIPVVILTTSQAEQDVAQAYDSHANCYITKPVDFERFLAVARAIESFWLTVASLPQPAPLNGSNPS